MEFTTATSQRESGALVAQGPLLAPSVSMLMFETTGTVPKRLALDSLISPSHLVPPPPPLTPAPPPIQAQGLKIPLTTPTSASVNSTSFLASMRNIKSNNNTLLQLEVPSTHDPMPPPPPLRSSVAATNTTTELAALLDVRRGFSKYAESTCLTTPSTLTCSSKTIPSDTVPISSGFQPYRSNESRDGIHSPSSKNLTAYNFNSSSSQVAPSFHFNHSIFPSQYNSPYSLEMEAFYRAQLEHFTTGMARQPFLIYPSVPHPFQGTHLGLVQPQLSSIVMQPAGPTISASKTPPLSLSVVSPSATLNCKSPGKTYSDKSSTAGPAPKSIKLDTSYKGREKRKKEMKLLKKVERKRSSDMVKTPQSNSENKTRCSKKPILCIPEVSSGLLKSLEVVEKTKLAATPIRQEKNSDPVCNKTFLPSVIPIVPNLNKLGIKIKGSDKEKLSEHSSNLELGLNKDSSFLVPWQAKKLKKLNKPGVDLSCASEPKSPFVRPFEDDGTRSDISIFKASMLQNPKEEIADVQKDIEVPASDNQPKAHAVESKIRSECQSIENSHICNMIHDAENSSNNHQVTPLNLKNNPQEKNFLEEKSVCCAPEVFTTEISDETDLTKLPMKSVTSDEETCSQDKLKYLRYFRLVSHRKRKVVEVPVQEASLREKNHLPRTRSTFESTMLSSSVGLMPPRSELLTQEWVHSTEKLSFLNLLHLNQLSQSEKSEHDVIWDVLLDERLSRHKKKNSTTTYLKNLREHLADEKVMNLRKSMNNTFIAPASCHSLKENSPLQIITHPSAQSPIAMKSKTKSTNSKISHPEKASIKVTLPINFSTLEPLSKSILQLDLSVDTSMPPELSASVKNQLGIIGEENEQNINIKVPPESSPMVSDSPVVWPGIQGVVDAFSKFNKERSDEILSLQSKICYLDRLAQSQVKKIDLLSTKITSLSTNCSTEKEKLTCLKQNIKMFEDILNLRNLD